MRLEKVVAEALLAVDNDKYLLANAVGKRAKQLVRDGVVPLVDMDVKRDKPTDIALHEIAEGKLKVSLK